MIKITNEDNMEMMARYPDKFFDLAIVDPPYGIGVAIGAHSNIKKLGNKNWDNETPKQEYFEELFRVSKNQIIWGGNYFNLSPSRCWIVWDKSPTPPSYSPVELAFSSFDENSQVWKGKTGNEVDVKNRIHPTQKPVALYKWLLSKYAKPGQKILDTHLGSGSIAIACIDLGFDLTACELDKDYYESAMKRIKEHQAQETLFKKEEIQELLFKEELN